MSRTELGRTLPGAGEKVWPLSTPAICELFLLAILVVLLVAWAPLYVRWPRSPDHEHLASLAFGWSAGLLPYRDFININFPGEIYLFWILGHLCGWSVDWSIYAFDLLCLAGTAVFLLSWSRRMTGRWVGGLAVFVIYLSYYTTQTYLTAAQRDSQMALLGLVCFLGPLAWPGRWSAAVWGVCYAIGFSVRPHMITFLPAIMLSLLLSGSDVFQRSSFQTVLYRLCAWAAGAIGASFVIWSPLIWAGLWPDFMEAMRLNLHGKFRDLGGNARPALSTLIREIFWAKAYLGIAVLIAVCGIFARWMRLRSTWAVVLVAQAGGVAYIMMHPARHNYLEQPLLACWALSLGLFLAELCQAPIEPRWGASLAIVLTMAFQYSHSQFAGSMRMSLHSLLGKIDRIEIWKRQSPSAYGHVTWEDYSSLREWLMANTSPTTRIANLAFGVNFASGVGRQQALPIEGGWIWYHPDSEPGCRKALLRYPDIVLIWLPDNHDADLGPYPELLKVIATEYEPAVRFGAIEARRRVQTALGR